ncbi:PREDICTED: uncharacterized protein LOC106932999 [Poecilia mexicana]|uniref:uncharacterized protein LOC106932999 n=1 Tax=Poecilia mexicana TaxID=48701 RepID=UPI00072EAFE5|nr:PREDICTED: uncharacterized protein LOC106932999 [Poecilia mexicana]
MDEIPRKKQKTENPNNSVSAKSLVEGVLQSNSGGDEILQEYETTETLTDATRRKLVNILVAHMIDKHGHLPTKAIREMYALGIVTLFPSLKDPYTKNGYIDQDFRLLFGEETSTRLLEKWDVFFKPNVIKEAKRLTSTPELRSLMQSVESLQSDDLANTSSRYLGISENTCSEYSMASLLLLLHILPPQPGGQKSPKISASDAVERLVVFHKSCCSLDKHLRGQRGLQPYLLAVGRQKSKMENFYIVLDKSLIPCVSNECLFVVPQFKMLDK